MRSTVKLLSILVIMIPLAGCPPRNYQFTNADTSNNGYRDDLFDGSPVAGAEGEGENEQPREVVEPDVIRRSGDVLYILNQYRGLTLVELPENEVGKANPTILSQVPTYGYPRDLYVVGTRAYVLVGYATDYQTEGNTISFSIASRVYVVDIADPADAEVISQFELNGDFVDSRLVGNVLYGVCAEYEWAWEEGTVMKAATSSSWVTSINVADPANIHQVDEVSFDGMGNVIQATNQAIFVAAYNWNEDATRITYVDIDDPAGDILVRGGVRVHGNVADKFKMDVYEGVLRVVSSGWTPQNGRQVYVTTVNLANPDELALLGETTLTDASGETLFATRFDGPRAYIVTYLIVDPLFVLDLSDPANPRVGANPLQVPGWSTHIEPQGDRLLALGVDDTNGRRVSCSMYDVSDPDNPKMVGERVTFGENWSWSSAYTDVKAFTVLDDLLIVPFSGWTSDFGGYERLQFISYTQNGLEARGYVDVDGAALRSFEYGSACYAVTTEQLVTIDASDLAYPAVTHRLTLAEYVADFFELTPSLGAQVVTAYNSGKTYVQTVGLAQKALGQVAVEIGSLAAAYSHGQSVVLVGTDWEESTYRSYYKVAIVDCSTPEAPDVAADIKIDAQPYWGWYWWMDRLGALEVDKKLDSATKSVVGPWWWRPYYSDDVTFLIDNVLVLRCYSDHFDSLFGDTNAMQGIALINLDTLGQTLVGLGYGNIVSMDAANGKLYIGTKEEAGAYFLQPMCAYYLQQMDVSVPSMGPAVNVPGIFVQYDADEDLLVVRNDQWSDELWDSAVETSLQTLSWNGIGAVEPLDGLALPSNAGMLKGRGAKVFFDTYDNGYNLYAVDVANDGDLELSEKVVVTTQWGSLLDAYGDTAYVTVGNALARYSFNSDAPTLQDVFLTMGYPLSVHFGSNYAYIPLGYSGIAQLPL